MARGVESDESTAPDARRERIGRVVGLVVLGILLAAPPPSGLSLEAWRTAAMGALMAVWWITEAVPIPATALLPVVLLPLLGVADVHAAAAPYANPVIFLFLGGFVLAAALKRSNLHYRLALGIIATVGAGPQRLVGGFMLATALLSMGVSNTATVVMLLPMALSVVELRERDGHTEPAFATALLVGLAYAASIGGIGTLIGTPPNALLAGFLEQTHGIRVGFVQWMAFGVPFVALCLPTTWWLLTRVLHPVGGGTREGVDLIARELRSLGPVTPAERRVAIVAALTAAAWVSRPLLEGLVPGLSDAGIAMTTAVVLFALPAGREGALVDWDDVRGIPWDVLVLFGGGLSLAEAITRTGLATWIGDGLGGLGTWPLVTVVALVAAVVTFLTELTSNTATAAAFLPVAASLAAGIGAEVTMLSIPVAVAASCAFMMPVATPPNALVYGSGRLTIATMARTGLVLNLLSVGIVTVLTMLLAPIVFP